MNLVPLLLLYLLSRSSSARAQPTWPTPASPPPPPPPPMPEPPAAPAHPAESSTPLSQIHAQSKAPAGFRQVKPPPPQRVTHTEDGTRVVTTPDSPSRATPRAERVSPPNVTSASVLELQKILNARGARVVQDGLYGPQTASAWSALAKRRGLPSSIMRLGPKTARVVSQTYEVLKAPPAP